MNVLFIPILRVLLHKNCKNRYAITFGYAGYANWYDFKKNHLFANEILSEIEESDEEVFQNGVDESVLDNQQERKINKFKEIADNVDEGKNSILQKIIMI